MNVQNGPQMEKKYELSGHATCVKIFADLEGFLYCSTDGKARVEYTKPGRMSFAFKAHRIQTSTTNKYYEAYMVNDCAVHPNQAQGGIIVTAGSEGRVRFWDKDVRSGRRILERGRVPISALDLNHDGTLLAYAASYDWSKGSGEAGMYANDPQLKPAIMVRDSNWETRGPTPAPTFGWGGRR